MAFSFLYYPHMAIPNEEWLGRVLLYSDVVASIVPVGYETRGQLPRYMQVLKDIGEFEYIAPQEYLARSEFREAFEDDVLDMLTSPEFKKWRHTRRLPAPVGGRKLDWNWPLPPEQQEEISLLSLEKTTNRVLEWLWEEGIVPAHAHPEWVPVRSDIAHLYVGTLAKHIASHSPQPLAPATDQLSYERAVIGRLGRQSKPRIPVADILLKKGLVVPRAGTPVGEIIAFKRHPAHWPELLEHRRFLREYQDRLSSAASSEELKDVAEDYEERLEAGIQRVQRMMQMARLKTATAAVKALCAMRWPDAWTAITSAVNVGVGTADASLALMDKDAAPFAYVFNATKHFGLHNMSRAWRRQ